MNAPTPRKILDDGRTIHTTQVIVPGNGLPFLSGLGECRFTDRENSDTIMPNPYRAPEVILKMGWDLKVDIWNVAMLVSLSVLCLAKPAKCQDLTLDFVQGWDIVSTRCLFQGYNADDIFDDRVHVAEMVALLGPLPPDLVARSKVGHVFWDEKSTSATILQSFGRVLLMN